MGNSEARASHWSFDTAVACSLQPQLIPRIRTRRCATTSGCSDASLGDTIRLHEGEQVFDVIEAIRQIAIRFHRNADEEAQHELQRIISTLPIDQGVQIIRAFGYF